MSWAREERMEPVNNLRVEIRMRTTAYDVYSVGKSWGSWRKLDSSAIRQRAAIEDLESRIESRTASSPMAVFFDYKTGGIAVVLSRR
jgi:hypothetical protein